MANPFQNIKDQRAAIQHQRIESRLKAELLEQEKQQALIIAEHDFEQVVMKVLEQLTQAAYPSNYCIVKSKSGSWQIGCTQWLVDGDGQQVSSWEAVAGVFLEYNEQKQSVAFDCWRKGKEVVMGSLSEAELIAALQLLYSN